MSNRNIFMDMGADTEVELHLKSNAMSFSKLFGDGDKIKSEYLPGMRVVVVVIWGR